ncbi:endolytic transglycosylase MltG [Saprospiraceae bacterium]|nr:endolytic transglycosylase MltG [Saprospiraceae bacterium]
MKKILLYTLFVILLLGGYFGYKYYNYIFEPNVILESDTIDIYVPSDGTMSTLMDSLTQRHAIIDTTSFIWVANRMKFQKVRPGKYIIKNNWNNKELVGLFRSGRESAVKLTFNNLRNVRDVAGVISKEIEIDSVTLFNYLLSDEAIESTGLTKATMMTLFIPNTYELYWDLGSKDIVDRFKRERDKFWTKDRLEKADKIGLTKEEVYTLASIVQKESNLNSEKPTIAGIYLNRLKKGILLQADPTVVFAVGDFSIRRVLNKHLAYDSPYNTYIYEGLPPGPIFMPDISTIDAVLNAEEHDYIYFCAGPGYNGKHQFAKTLSQHLSNARKYHNWLNKEKIYN